MGNKKKTSAKKSVDQNVFAEKAISNSEMFNKTVEIREKRIGIVFKVIYVIAIFFAAIFLLVAENQEQGITDMYIVESCASTFLFFLLYRMVVYIFNELKCLKLNNNDVPEEQISRTEYSYSQIFNYFVAGGIASLIIAIALVETTKYLTQDILRYVSIASIILGSVICNTCDRKNWVWQSVGEILWTIAIIAALILKSWSA